MKIPVSTPSSPPVLGECVAVDGDGVAEVSVSPRGSAADVSGRVPLRPLFEVRERGLALEI